MQKAQGFARTPLKDGGREYQVYRDLQSSKVTTQPAEEKTKKLERGGETSVAEGKRKEGALASGRESKSSFRARRVGVFEAAKKGKGHTKKIEAASGDQGTKTEGCIVKHQIT